MTTDGPTQLRAVRRQSLDADLAVVGGGLAGVCCAITAARQGVRVILVQDRPVLGGNASSEVRLWALGATAHMHNNNRWAREGGVIDEIIVENTWRNREGNPILFDALLLEKVVTEPNITLLLNTAVTAATKDGPTRVAGLQAFNSQNSTWYDITAKLFCDASGDGILGYCAGAAYRIGAEPAAEFGEGLAPKDGGTACLGHTIYFYSKQTAAPVTYVPPAFALKDITRLPHHTWIKADSTGCLLWWLEYGGRLDTVHDTEQIKWELWKVAYGVWDYLKNSGKFPETANQTLEWIGQIPGKRESRRFEGLTMLTQNDIVQQTRHPDAVSYGGWAIDLHPPDGLYGKEFPCTQYHSRGVYQIPYRCLVSRNIENLFLAGRLISASHVAFGSTRVMMTCAHSAQAVGMAAALCLETGAGPHDLVAPDRMRALQQRLVNAGQFIPHVALSDEANLARQAEIIPSSVGRLKEFRPAGQTAALDRPRGVLLPAGIGRFPRLTFRLTLAEPREVTFELRGSQRPGNFTPDRLLATRTLPVPAGADQSVAVDFDYEVDTPQYLLACLQACAGVSVTLSEDLAAGVVAVTGPNDGAGNDHESLGPAAQVGCEDFAIWPAQRRPQGKLLAVAFEPPLTPYRTEYLLNGYHRPFIQTNSWAADASDRQPQLTFQWKQTQRIGEIILFFDADADHPMESVQLGHPERVMPQCVKHFRLRDDQGRVLFEEPDNHQARVAIRLSAPVETRSLTLELPVTHGSPATVYSVIIHGMTSPIPK